MAGTGTPHRKEASHDHDLGRHRRRENPSSLLAINEEGRRLLSRRVANDEPDLLKLLTDVLALGETVAWRIDLADGGAVLAIAVLVNHAQPVHYISGRAIHRA